MSKVYDDDVLERVGTRRCCAAKRLHGRQDATTRVVKAIDELIAAGAPDDYDSEEAEAFMLTLKNHKLRMVGKGAPEMLETIENGHQPPDGTNGNWDQCEWSPRYSKEDFADLRRRGYGVADWRLL